MQMMKNDKNVGAVTHIHIILYKISEQVKKNKINIQKIIEDKLIRIKTVIEAYKNRFLLLSFDV